jgi:DNA-binding CsgD family transcriptional regulator/tetratricopeptide (TPR) repeat protein
MPQATGGLFGRDRELGQAHEAVVAAGTGSPQVLLVGGDAGIGKTSLVTRVGERAREAGFTVLVGHCLDIDNGVPIQSVREALRGAVADRSAEDLPPVTRRMATFLLGGAPGGSGSASSALEDLGLVVAELSAESPLMLVLEDMHWADRSTQDFAVTLSRTARGPVCLVLTFRTDELTRRHPFRRALVELGRSAGARRLDLQPLDRDGISGIVEQCTGRRDQAFVGATLARSEGNPLYAEELLQAGPAALAGPLGDLLLARVDALSPPTRELLRLASVGGSRLDPPVLADLSAVDDLALETCLREAIDANVLRASGEHLDFRHGLLREAIYDDLLPGERTRAHARMAACLQARLGDDAEMAELGVLAFHWYAAHDQTEAFRASVRAGRAARTYGGPEAVTHLERALELYDQVPHEGGIGDVPKADLVRLLAEACKEHHDFDRASVLMREALDLLDDDTEPLLASRVYSSYAVLCGELEGHLHHREAVERAIAYAEGEPSEELATALYMMSRLHWRQEQIAEAFRYAERAIEVATAVPVPAVEAVARQSRGWSHWNLGRIDEALADFEAAAKAAARGGSVAETLWSEVHRALVLIDLPDSDAWTGLVVEVRDRARAQGLPDVAQECAIILARGYLQQGRLDDADLLLSELTEEGLGPDHHLWREARSLLLLHRGDAAAALPLERDTMALWRSVAVIPDWEFVTHHVRVLEGNGLIDEAVSVGREYVEMLQDADGIYTLAGAAVLGYVTLAAAQRAGLPLDEDLLARADAKLEQAAALITGRALATWGGTHLALARALRADLVGEPSTDLWQTAYDACSRIGAGHALQAWLGLAHAVAASGERDRARSMLPELWAHAREMGALGVADDVARLARRHRIPLPDGQVPNRLDVLTAREREVLDVLATGATNLQIAERLFISKKTVSVHVTNLLAKLGVTNRGAAAALARELTRVD